MSSDYCSMLEYRIEWSSICELAPIAAKKLDGLLWTLAGRPDWYQYIDKICEYLKNDSPEDLHELYCETHPGATDKAADDFLAKIHEAFIVDLQEEFQRNTKVGDFVLGILAEFHDAEAEGSRYDDDEARGGFFYVDGDVTQLTPAAERISKHLQPVHYVVWG